ncbi:MULTISPECIES: helix-turn-helix transcriptional regulator [Akkermansia]|uniref:helix-turn-helix domain-containing protein n=1 Tax=Akkermansia TaxID=239934 RepID=UPI000C9A5F85|nr:MULTISPECIES: helix-turn-helix transcriptional regulator [Akkermansia]MCD8320603.1 helix-turn-helix transcriptional regulator [Akkermansia sp.]PNC85271.1 hypothetical protein CXT97_11395 [Akkermansia muciniphila]PND01217.1 hypothetical protein CXT90_01785 [Akkermansia muciniphila]QHV66063.1 XRE family transcriptional regulator [Akkermansia muciniphila]QHV68501.1 XRE family transcriptional regulator [Akkermansia muciniphila]
MQQKNLPNGNFPSRLKSILQSKNMKQRELGKLAGLSNVAISRYLSGERRPGADELYRISTILGVSMEWLLVGTEPEQKITDWQSRAESAERQLMELKKAVRVLLSTVSVDD